jgi:citronellol/citronellal dehydrogenase
MLQPGERRCDGMVALVTGASRGIGAATAVRLARAGAAVAITARTLDDDPSSSLSGSLRQTLAAIEAEGAVGHAIAANLDDPDERAAVVPAAVAQLGPIDILVNNAAAALYGNVSDLALRRRELLFSVNVQAPLDLMQAVATSMCERRRGWIVNLSSATSRHPSGPPYAKRSMGTTTTVYGASKAALERITTGLAAELFEHDIAVNAIAPVAAVRTEGADALVGDLLDPSVFEPIEYLTEAILYLATCRPAECTGQILTSQALLRQIGLLTDDGH